MKLRYTASVLLFLVGLTLSFLPLLYLSGLSRTMKNVLDTRGIGDPTIMSHAVADTYTITSILPIYYLTGLMCVTSGIFLYVQTSRRVPA